MKIQSIKIVGEAGLTADITESVDGTTLCVSGQKPRNVILDSSNSEHIARVASSLQEALDGYVGSYGDVVDYYNVLSQFAK
jgi:hypothetical protein